MIYPKPIFWHSGQFLEPQHFQETDRYHLHERGEMLRLVRPCFHGVARLDVNPAALALGTLTFDHAELYFPDGTYVLWNGRPEDGNSSPVSRALPEMEDGSIIVHGRLDRFRARHNAAGRDKASLPHPERYDAVPDEIETPDRYVQEHPTLSGDERILIRLNHNVRLLWPSELGDGAGGMTLPLLRIVRQGDALSVDPDFVPPLAAVHGNEWLVLRLRRFMRLLADFPRRAGERSSGAPSLDEILTRQIAARLLADVDMLLSWDRASPWETYRAIRSACAETGAVPSAPPEAEGGIPLYDHYDLHACFSGLLAYFEQLLGRFLPETVAVVDPVRSEGLFVFALPEAAFAPGVSFRLALRSGEAPEALLAEGRLIAGSPDAVRDAVKLALPKVPLSVVSAPRGLPSTDGVRWFAPGESHPSWKDVLVARRLAVAYYPRRDAGTGSAADAMRLYILRGGAL